MMTKREILASARANDKAEAGGEGSLWSYNRWTETTVQRLHRLARIKVDPRTAETIRRAFGG